MEVDGKMKQEYKVLNCRRCNKPAYKVGGWVRTDKDREWKNAINCNILCSSCNKDEYDILLSLRYEHNDSEVGYVEYDSIVVLELSKSGKLWKWLRNVLKYKRNPK